MPDLLKPLLGLSRGIDFCAKHIIGVKPVLISFKGGGQEIKLYF